MKICLFYYLLEKLDHYLVQYIIKNLYSKRLEQCFYHTIQVGFGTQHVFIYGVALLHSPFYEVVHGSAG